MAEAKISIKVFVDKVRKRVVYAEADHTFVDILFSFMTMPMGTIVRLLSKASDEKIEALGSLNILYQSLNDFPESYLATEECKFMLLNPRNLSYDLCRNLKLKIDDTEPLKYFLCGDCRSKGYTCNMRFSICNKAKCIRCGKLMSSYHSSAISNVFVGGGMFVSDIATFIVTDDLSVIPYSAAGILRLLADLGINDTSLLEERKLDLDSKQMLYLVKMAFSLDSPLTCYVLHEHNMFLNPRQSITFHRCDPMNKETTTSSKMVLEVSLQKSTGKFLFAEAKEDFVDFVFGFLSIPLGTVIGTLMKGTSSIRCFDNLFRSILNMNVERYFKSQDTKNKLVKPPPGQEYCSKNMIFPLIGHTITSLSVSGYSYQLKDPRIEGSFLKQSGLFYVTDDLSISPSSSHLVINTLNKLKVKVDDIEKHEITIGFEEGLNMLKASLRSQSTLTNIIKHQLKK
ncbi:hypothetical protein SSX86_002739 [Deinandra increscens subsp. villosa]|uniref:DUF674 family protein n=1 Tax=Deinandra increscens subsp. villosa TaxID=3103831 RepID=A0AAP0DTE7_9ASTR